MAELQCSHIRIKRGNEFCTTHLLQQNDKTLIMHNYDPQLSTAHIGRCDFSGSEFLVDFLKVQV